MSENIREIKKKTPFMQLLQVLVAVYALYVAFVLSFPFLTGDQLHYRESRSNMPMIGDTAGIGELTADSGGVNQVFITNVQRIERIDVLWYTFGRENNSTVYVELYRQHDMELLAAKAFNAIDIPNGGTTSLVFDTPLEGVAGLPLVLRLSSPDAIFENAICPAYNRETTIENSSLSYRFQGIPGTLCFSVSGEDYIWLGLNYWKIVLCFGVILALFFAVVLIRVKVGKKSEILNAVLALKKYRFLMRQLVSRDFKTKYKRSVLGVLWSLLNPLLTTLVQYFVFSNLFRFDIPYFPVYLLAGSVLFNFFTESCGMSLTSIVGNASLITKVYIPKYIYPFTRTISSLINLAFALIPLFAVTFISGLKPNRVYVLLPIVIAMLVVFSMGMGMILSSLMVFFRDTQFLWGVFSMIWMYCSALFYPASIIPEKYRFLVEYNPVYCYICIVRTILIDGVSTEPVMYIKGAIFAIAMIVFGAVVFKKTQDKFVFYL